MLIKELSFLGLAALAMAGCKPVSQPDNPLKTQTEVLNQAKAVEGQLQTQAQEQAKAIEDAQK